MVPFLKELVRHAFISEKKEYYLWLAFLVFFVGLGAITYLQQINDGLIITHLRDQVSWGFYIANFTFLVGVAAAAVMLVIPAYIYQFKPIKEIVLFGEMLAISAVVMCILFVMIDMGKPLHAWHIMWKPNWPISMLVWDVIVLNGYLFINLAAVTYVLYNLVHNKEYSMKIMWPIVLISIPWAISIHTVTAFLYNGLVSRPFWNASIIAPRFIASALCSGPALMLIIFQIARIVSKVEITDRAIFKIAELIAYAMAINLYLYAAELFKEFYSSSLHMAPMEYLFKGLHGNENLVPFTWMALFFNLIAFFLFLVPQTRKHFPTLNLACVLVIIGVYLEKGMGLIVPGFIPSTLGEIYPYMPNAAEIKITAGVWAFGALLYTIMVKTAIPIYIGELRMKPKRSISPHTK